MSASRPPASPAAHRPRPAGRAGLDRLRLLGRVEGVTLLALLFVAVPLKHAAGLSAATSIVGPIHGLAFVAYLVAVVETLAGGGWSRRDGVRLFSAALVPFGTFANERFLIAREHRGR